MSQAPTPYFRKVILLGIRWYQKNLSPDHSSRRALYPAGYCRFHPTCSEYAYQAIEKYGIARGGLKALWRVVRCNPWSKGGVDVP